jgi:hypothetical protein
LSILINENCNFHIFIIGFGAQNGNAYLRLCCKLSVHFYSICENRDKPELRCNGKCYVKKEILKSSENENTKESKVQITSIDAFVLNEILDFSIITQIQDKVENNFQNHFNSVLKPYLEVFFIRQFVDFNFILSFIKS